jgi:hypothetical protein
MATLGQKNGIQRTAAGRHEFTGNVRGDVYAGPGDVWYVNTQIGSSGDGRDWDGAFKTMSEALTAAQTNDTIYFVGDVREELTGSNLKFDITIVGCGNKPHHPDLPAAGYDVGAACWRPPASPTTATPLLKVRGRGWRFVNILFDCPVDAAAVKLETNALSGTSEFSAGHASFIGCRFDAGLIGIEDAGGAGFVEVRGCYFRGMTGSGSAGIKCTSTAVAVPLCWVIEDNHFLNNASHILASMSYATIRNNVFGRFTATLSIDVYNQPSAGQGEYNVITRNYLSGAYGVTAYPAGSNNEWGGNDNVAGATSADPT